MAPARPTSPAAAAPASAAQLADPMQRNRCTDKLHLLRQAPAGEDKPRGSESSGAPNFAVPLIKSLQSDQLQLMQQCKPLFSSNGPLRICMLAQERPLFNMLTISVSYSSEWQMHCQEQAPALRQYPVARTNADYRVHDT
eukprot:GHUV01038404.1.p1 GENE.GHUV01038404.1~~GHUV01038404.1.p1  ORF type:complete len:156 (-),score=17.46 GHUV01038404.1:1095-1514(-)